MAPFKKRKAKRRTRYRYVKSKAFTQRTSDNAITWQWSGDSCAGIFEDATIGPCNAYRQWQMPFSGDWQRGDQWYNSVENHSDVYWFHHNYSKHLWEPYALRLDPSKTATHNEFSLLTALAELDDTLLMFSKNLAKTASYGGYKWGLTPLLSDISALNDAGNKVKNAILGPDNKIVNKYADSYSYVRSHFIDFYGGRFKHEWDVKVKMTGEISYEYDILAFYDFLGFHPSPKVLWDLVPFSFAVDWVLPIGDILKNLTPSQGWVKSANFYGWQCVQAKLKETVIKPYQYGQKISYQANFPDRNFFYRTRHYGTAIHEKRIPKQVDLINLPNVYQAFDIGYLAKSALFPNRKSPPIKPIFRPATRR